MENENEKPPEQPQSPEPEKGKISKRELVFVEHLLAGCTPPDAARKAGYREAGAQRANAWIRETRELSDKKYLYDHWRKRLDIKLRILDVTSENVIRELSLIGFSSIDRFIDFPSRKDAEDELNRDAQLVSMVTGEPSSDDDESDSKSWKKYRPGSSIKLKCIEDIPAELMPAIAEIHETKEGIRIKLHSKLDALDKLCRIMKMYTDDRGANNELQDYSINIEVKGSRSPLLNGTK